jgi:hypothetical protein
MVAPVPLMFFKLLKKNTLILTLTLTPITLALTLKKLLILAAQF